MKAATMRTKAIEHLYDVFASGAIPEAVVVDAVVSIEKAERQRLSDFADSYFHFGGDHDGEFVDCQVSKCVELRWFISEPKS